MSIGEDRAFNRHSFLAKSSHGHRSTLGVNSEFVHSKILDRVEKLIANLEQAVKNPGSKSGASATSESMKEKLEIMKSDAPDHKQVGIIVLKECVAVVDGQLNNTPSQLTP